MTTLAFTSAGSTVYLSAGVPATIDGAGFAALTYTKINEVTDIGAIGPKVAMVTHVPVDQSVTYKLKTITDNGSVQLKGARATSDAGQTLLQAAVASFAPYALKIVLQTGTIIYSQVLALGYNTTIGTAGVVTTFDSDMAVSGAIVVV
jgi:hypothetical protein